MNDLYACLNLDHFVVGALIHLVMGHISITNEGLVFKDCLQISVLIFSEFKWIN